MQSRKTMLAVAIMATAALSGCSNMRDRMGMSSSYPSSFPSASVSGQAGTIEAIQLSRTDQSSTSGMGTSMPDTLGNQPSGYGSAAAGTAGADTTNGTMAPNESANSQRTYPREMYQVTVRLDDGSYQTVSQENIADLRVGSRVRLENERLFKY